MSRGKESPIKFLMIDLFCGGGGTTTGAEASGVCKVVAAVNHDQVCIQSHNQNHPEVMHFQEDIRLLNIAPMREHLDRMKAIYPQSKVILWASLECTNFSKAKGALPRDPDSRTLADHLPRYVTALDPDYIQIENVEEFMAWGDLDENGKPCSTYEGKEYYRWCNDMCALGYHYGSRLINAADLGAHTSRKRLFGCFARPGEAIVFPELTHAKQQKNKPSLFDGIKWNPVREVLDLHIHGNSIFGRKKPLCDKTLKRILEGLKKFVPPAQMIQHHNSPGYCSSLDEPCGTITTAGHKSLVTPILMGYYGNATLTGVEQPCGTITTKARHALVQFIDYQYSGVKTGYSTDVPLWSITTTPKNSLCTAFIVNPQYSNKGSSINAPAPTVIASQKAMPLGISHVEYGYPVFEVCDTDTEIMRELKRTCIELGIADICLRMLSVRELKRIQGFPEDYKLAGNSADQKKQIGNSVAPIVPKKWLEAMANSH